MATVSAGDGYPVAILNCNQPAFYCVPAELYEKILDALDDQELVKLVAECSNQPQHDVDLDSYLCLIRSALKEWHKLDKAIQQQFAKKLKMCTENPHIPSEKLRGIKDCYKIKLRASGFRLVYQVIDDQFFQIAKKDGKTKT